MWKLNQEHVSYLFNSFREFLDLYSIIFFKAFVKGIFRLGGSIFATRINVTFPVLEFQPAT